MAAALRRLSSISFSGAGFLTCYHLGVAHCLLENGLICLDPPKDSPAEMPSIITGVSGGALVSSALICGIPPERSMEAILKVASNARRKTLNIYHPGYSLIDAVEQHLVTLFSAIDDEQLQERVRGGKLRIGFTDGRVFPPFGYNPKAYLYIDSFQSVDDVVAACVLSSYVPGATGPLLSSNVTNQAVQRSQAKLSELAKQGFVKNFFGISIEQDAKIASPIFVDGGLVNVWPVVDADTLIVTPLSAQFQSHNYICPLCTDSKFFAVNPYSSLAMHYSNVSTLQDMIWSSVDDVLEQRFAQGHDNAREFLERNNLLSQVYVVTAAR
jgi:Patatin-like phospholipase